MFDVEFRIAYSVVSTSRFGKRMLCYALLIILCDVCCSKGFFLLVPVITCHLIVALPVTSIKICKTNFGFICHIMIEIEANL